MYMFLVRLNLAVLENMSVFYFTHIYELWVNRGLVLYWNLKCLVMNPRSKRI